MLDIQFIREHPEVVKESQRKRGESVELVDEVLRADEERRSSLKQFEEARARQKEIGKQVAKAAPDEKAKLIAQTKELSEQVASFKASADTADEQYTTAMWQLSNIVEPQAPEGGEDDYVVMRKVGQIRDFAAEGFEPKDHLTLGEEVAGIDMKRGVKVSGSRFYFLRGDVARLQIAMLTMAVDQAQEHGFILAITPTLVRPEVMRGTGFLNSHADEIYRLREPDDDYLVGTSEVALAGMHENEILDLSDGAALLRMELLLSSRGGRRRQGHERHHSRPPVRQGGDVRLCQAGELRCRAPEASRDGGGDARQGGSPVPRNRHGRGRSGFLGSTQVRLRGLGSHAGPLPRAHVHLELHAVPGTPTQHSRARCRRRHLPVATLNGTLATTRWLVAILENHQQADGSIEIPKAMRPYMGGKEVIEPRKWEA